MMVIAVYETDEQAQLALEAGAPEEALPDYEENRMEGRSLVSVQALRG